MEKVKIGFVGTGAMGQCAHLRSYVSLPDCEVVAIAELREHLARQVTSRYHIRRFYHDHRSMLAAEKLDGIVASQPFTRHGQLLPELLAAGVPVFIEKPLASSVAVGEKILAAMEAARTWIMVGYHKRSDPACMQAKAEIDRLQENGELGRLRYIRLLMPAGDWTANGFLNLITSDEEMPQLESDPPAADMSAEVFRDYVTFVNYYIHQVNLLRYFLGEPYRVTYADPSGVLLAVQSRSGIPGTIEMSPYVTTSDWQESAFIAFEKGWLEVQLPAPLALNRCGSLRVFRDPGNGVLPMFSTPQLPPIDAMRQQAMNFVRAIRGEINPLCGAEEALEDLKAAREYLWLWKER